MSGTATPRATSGRTWQEAMAPLLDALAAEEVATTAQAVARVRAEIPSYGGVTDASLCASARRNTQQALRVLRDRRPPDPDDVRADAHIAAQRAAEGVPLEDALRAYRISLRAIAVAFERLAAGHRLAPGLVAEGVDLLWQFTDIATVEIAAVHRDAELHAARRDQHARAELLRGLLLGGAAPSEVRARAAAFGLVPDRSYLTVRGRARNRGDSERLRAALRATDGGGDRPAFVELYADDVAGIVPAHPRLAVDWAVVAVGPPATLSTLEPSFATASRVLDVAVRYGRTGVVGLVDLGVRLAVANETELGRALVGRYLAPLEAEGPFGRLLEETLLAFLDSGFSTKRTARVLGVHPNTLRHRLKRFAELTGTDVLAPDTALEVWWALQRRRLDRAAAGGGDGGTVSG